MKNHLSNRSGFTLIELLVVVAIIAILAVMGFAAYRGFVAKGDDSRREADLKSIGDAMEANKSSNGYQPLSSSQFASGSIPVDPVSGHVPYCISFNNSGSVGSPPSLSQLISSNDCNSSGVVGVGANGTGWSDVSSSTPTTGSTIWMICYVKEDNSTIVCRNSGQ